MTVRSLFSRFVYKKNGKIRPWYQNSIRCIAKETPSFAIESQLRYDEELTLEALKPLETAVLSWRGKPDPETLIDVAGLSDMIRQGIYSKSHKLVVSVSHDNYRKVPGGLQLCVEHEEIQAAKEGFGYLQIHPWHALPRLNHLAETPDTLVGLVLDGADVGVCLMSNLIATLQKLSMADLNQSEVSMVVTIHHMRGHNPEQLLELVHASRNVECIFWLHDFFSICPSYTLQRNTLTFCGAPASTSNACELCVFGVERQSHSHRMATFFRSVAVNVVSPSSVTADFWQARSGLKAASLKIVPHMALEFMPCSEQRSKAPDRPVTIAYLGAPVVHKGWSIFAELVSEFSGSRDYQFVAMTNEPTDLKSVKWVNVSVTGESPTAMSDAVEQSDVDLVIHWPSWPETFSFTTFEALAGSAYVVTNTGSGNVAAAVLQTGRGVVLSDRARLLEYFRNGAAKVLADQRRQASQMFKVRQTRSRMSFEVLKQ